MFKKQVSIVCANYKGETRERNIIPEKIIFASNKWHKVRQWLLIAYDVDKKSDRTFAMKDISKFSNQTI